VQCNKRRATAAAEATWQRRYLVEQHAHIALHYEGVYVGGGEEALANHVLQLLQQCVKEPARVQQCDGLVVNLELLLAQKFRKLFERSETPCTSDNTASANEVATGGDKGVRGRCSRAHEWRNTYTRFTYASLASNIFALRSAIVSVTSVSPTISPESSAGIKNFGIQPLTLPPLDSTVRAICNSVKRSSGEGLVVVAY
jgi:hypothetical protein